MKYFALFACLTSGCAHHLSVVDTQNGVERLRVEGDIGIYSTDVATTGSDVQMDTCLAKIGHMPGGEEVAICAAQVHTDAVRRGRSLDWQSVPYGAYPYAPLR